VCALVDRHQPPLVTTDLDAALCEVAAQTELRVARAIDDFALHDALRAVFELVAAANRYVDSSAPWQLAKAQTGAAALAHCLSSLVHALRVTARLLAPFLPSTAREIDARLEPRPHLGPPLFPALPRD
jgi:methionyl-tRNA synthetase